MGTSSSGSGAHRSPRRHPTGGRVPAETNRAGLPRRTWVLLGLAIVVVFAGLRGIHALVDRPALAAEITGRVVVVGVTGRPELTAADRQLIGDHLGEVHAGMMAIRPRYVGDCAAAGWTTLGAGRRAAVGRNVSVAGLCDVTVRATGRGGQVERWPERVRAAAEHRGDARLGTLGHASGAGCVAAVGPGAALAAADADGMVDRYQTAQQFREAGLALECPVTLVDAAGESDSIAAELAGRDEVTLILTGVGPAEGSDDPALQVAYRIGTSVPGWLTSASTRREGIVTLTDLTRTLIQARDREGGTGPSSPSGETAESVVDGSPLAALPTTLTVPEIAAGQGAVTALSDAAPTGYLVLGIGGAGLFLLLLGGLVWRRYRIARAVLTFGSVLPAAMMLTGAIPWQFAARPGLTLSLAVWVWAAVLTAAAALLGRIAAIPATVAGAALTVAAFTVDAALGGPMQAGSMLNSRPIFALRWYGFGNVTFAAYAAAGLVVAGFVAHRLVAAQRRRTAALAVAGIGFSIVLCEGWPSMGSDFGGVIALTPVVLAFVLALWGVRLTGPRLLAIGGSAVAAVAAISFLDWARGPDRRSHLGNFVARVLEGDALAVISRKAVASAETIASPLGIGSLVLGVALWVLLIKMALPDLVREFGTLRHTVLAILAVGVLGTLVNDGGISVWITATTVAAVTVGWLWVDARVRR